MTQTQFLKLYLILFSNYFLFLFLRKPVLGKKHILALSTIIKHVSQRDKTVIFSGHEHLLLFSLFF